MKLEITRKIDQNETVEIDLPYYYAHDLRVDEADVVIYGKIEAEQSTSITIRRAWVGGRGNEFELIIERCPASDFGYYMTNEYKSSEAKYLEAKAELLAAAQDA